MEGLMDCKTVFKEMNTGGGRTAYMPSQECRLSDDVRDILHLLEDLSSPRKLIMVLIELIFLTAFWLCTIFSRRDFTRNFLITVVTPMTIKLLCRIVFFVNSVVNVTRVTYSEGFSIRKPDYPAWYGTFTTLNGINNNFTTSIFVFATPIFLVMVMKTANTRKALTPRQHWLPFLICAITVLIAQGIFWYAPFPWELREFLSMVLVYAGEAASLVIIVMLFAMCFMCCCCSSRKSTMDYSDPVVYNARSRLAWTCVFICFAPVGSQAAGVFRGNNDYLGSLIQKIIYGFHTTTVMVAVFLFLPAYRSALFCCCVNYRERNLPHKVSPPPSTTVSTIAPRPSAPPTPLAPPPAGPIVTQPAQNQGIMVPVSQPMAPTNQYQTPQWALYPNLNVPIPSDPTAMIPQLNLSNVIQVPHNLTIVTPHATFVSSPLPH